MIKSVIAATAVALIASAAGADPVGEEGAGASTCGQFERNYRANPEHAEIVYFSWAQGAMSGMNTILMIQQKPPTDLNKESLEDQKDYLRNFCDAHPLAPYYAGVFALFGEMAKP